MITIKDIAKYAGVSHGTVSNVLNKNGNVSAEKIRLVEKAVKKLGYKPNSQASQLRARRSNKFVVIIPNIKSPRYTDFYNGILNALKNTEYELEVLYTNNDIKREANALRAAQALDSVAIILVPSGNHAIAEHECDNLYFFESKIPNKPCFKFDYQLAGAEMAQRCSASKKVAISCQPEKNSFNREVFSGITSVLDEKGIAYSLFTENDANELQAAFNISTDKEFFDSVITTNLLTAQYVSNLKKFKNETEVDSSKCLNSEIITISSYQMVNKNTFLCYELNYELAGYSIVSHILEEKEFTDDIQFTNNGFAYSDLPGYHKNSDHLNFLILNSPTATLIQRLLPDFTRKTGINVRLIEMPYNELYREAKDNENNGVYDIIRLDVVWMQNLAKSIFINLSESNLNLKGVFNCFSKSVPKDYFYVDDGIYGLPFDSSVQILYFRKDLFEDALIKREYFEKYKAQLHPPENYVEYKQICEFFTRSFNPKSPTEYGTAQSYGTPISAASDYLPRLIGEKGISFKNGKIIIDEEIFIKTLDEYVNIQEYCNKGTVNTWWNQVFEQFISGQTAMCTVYSNHASRKLEITENGFNQKIGYCSIPLNSPFLGGGVLGITKTSKKADKAAVFLNWLYSNEIANICTYMGGFINNKSIFENVPLLELHPWLRYMEQTFLLGSRRNIGITAPHFDEYIFETEIGKTVRFVSQRLMSSREGFHLIKSYIDKVNKVRD